MRSTLRILMVMVMIWLAIGLLSPASQALEPPPLNTASLIPLEGTIWLQKAGTAEWTPVGGSVLVAAGDRLRTEANSRAMLVFFEDTITELKPGTDLVVQQLQLEQGKPFIIRMQLWFGDTLNRVRPFLDPASRHEIETPSATVTVQGTVHRVWVDERLVTGVETQEGVVAVTGQGVTVMVRAGEKTTVEPGNSPSPPGPITAPTFEGVPSPSPAVTGVPTFMPVATATLIPTTPPTVPLRPAGAGLITDFEIMETWQRGDEPYGTFTQSSAQAYSGAYSGQLVYDFPTAGNDYVVFLRTYFLGGRPNQISAWVNGDGSGHYLNVWIKDSGGETWQATFGRVQHQGWQLMTARLDPTLGWPAGHISGAANGVIDYPIDFRALVLDDAPDSFVGGGVIYIDDLRAEEVIAPPTATPTSTSTPTATSPAPPPPPPPPSGPPSISFRVDNDHILAGGCTTLRWDVENVREVYLDGDGVVGHGSKEVCPDSTTTYTLEVVKPDGSSEDRTVTVTVLYLLSDRNLKENFAPVDGQEVLARLAEIPLTTWNYKAQEPTIRHMGPMAQDFYAAFGLGEDERHISTIDTNGVALAAIQGLHQLSQEQAARIEALGGENAALKQRLDDLEALVANGSAPAHPVQAGFLPGAGVFLASLGLVWLTRRGGGQ